MVWEGAMRYRSLAALVRAAETALTRLEETGDI